MANTNANDWKVRWDARGEAVRRVFGETIPPNSVASFSWNEYLLPGACAMTFRLVPPENGFITMSLGLTQPLEDGDKSYPWEFAIRLSTPCEWAVDLLYQLVTQWLHENGNMWFGYHLPLVFFTDQSRKRWAGVTNDISELNTVGFIRAMYLWLDESSIQFDLASGSFGLLTVVAVTEDEVALANETTPAHLMLLLNRMGITQLCDPDRKSVLTIPRASSEWEKIRCMSHDDALHETQPQA